jgi:hypothetical protein
MRRKSSAQPERLGAKSLQPEQETERIAHGGIVLDDKYGLFVRHGEIAYYPLAQAKINAKDHSSILNYSGSPAGGRRDA